MGHIKKIKNMGNKNEKARKEVQKIFNIGDRIYYLDDDRIVTGIIDVVVTKKIKYSDKNSIRTMYLYEVENGCDGAIRSDRAFASLDDLVKHLKKNIVDLSVDEEDDEY